MEDLFTIDDTHVDIVQRPRTERRASNDVEDYPSALPRQSTDREDLNRRQAPSDDEDDFNFDYLPARRAKSPDAPFNLGLDEEVVVNRRAPRAKLDEERLLGPLGIPKIRDDLSKKIRFRGKGHELNDLGRLIEQYQFWAHELFPKAKFRDALKMVGKVGKTRSMQSHRRRIITEFLPRPEYFDDANSDESDLDIAAPRAMPSSVPVRGQVDVVEQDLFTEDVDMSDFEEAALHAKMAARPAQGLQGVANDIPEEMPMEEAIDMDDMDALEAMGVMV